MPLDLPADERVLERLTAFAGGKLQEFVLTDKAVYYEGQRAPIATWLSAILMPILAFIGLGLFYYYLRGGRVMVRHSLERIDAVTVRRIPLPGIAQIGGLLALIFGVNFGLQVYVDEQNAQQAGLVGYGVAVGLCIVTAFFLVRFQLSSLSVNSFNGNFTYDTYGSFADLQRVQNRIWEARGELMNRLWPGVNLPPPPPPPAQQAAAPAAQQAPAHQTKPAKRKKR